MEILKRIVTICFIIGLVNSHVIIKDDSSEKEIRSLDDNLKSESNENVIDQRQNGTENYRIKGKYF